MPKHITKDKKEELIAFYKSRPMTVQEAATSINVSVPSAIKILDQYRVKRYTKVQLFSPSLVEDYFEKIDTESKAYFLGLIITDGCIYKKHKKQSSVSLSLQSQDRYILDRFKQEINSNKTITRDGRGCNEISILSDKMVSDLSKYGVTENKSLKTVFPQGIRADLYPHLIRGILDGDGSISYYARKKRKSHTKAIRFCQGNEQFLLDLMCCLKKYAGVNPVNARKEKESLWSIAYRNNDSMCSLISYIYDSATVYLKRKKILCDNIIGEINKYNGNSEITDSFKSVSES